MQVNIKQLDAGLAGHEALEFEGKLDFSAVRLWGSHPFAGPVRVSGRVEKQAGIYSLDYTADYRLDTICARCTAPVNRDGHAAFTRIVVEELEEESSSDELVLAPDGVLLMDELVQTDLLLELDSVILCSETCRGICPVCGANRNEIDCSCDTSVPDPRFDALRALLDKNTDE